MTRKPSEVAAEATSVEYNGSFDDQGRARAVSHYFRIAGRDVQIYVTKKHKKIRVFVDHKELGKGSL